MAGDIIEKGLNLSVTGEDLASDVFAALADQVADLEARFETAFAGMASYAEDAASTLADAANAWVPQWISQLEALETVASGTFQTVAASAETQAALAEGYWAGAFTGIAADADTTAGKVDASLATIGAESSANGGAVAASWSSSLDAISADAATAAGKVDTALDGIGGAADANGSAVAGDWSTNLDKIATDAAGTATAVDGSLDGIGATAAVNGSAVAGDWNGNLNKIAADADATATKVDAALDGIAAGSNGDGGDVAASWSTDLDKIVTDADATAAKVNASLLGIGSEAAANGDALATDWSANLDKIAADADAAAAKIEAAFVGTSAATGETAATGGAAGKGAAGASTAEEEEAAGAGGILGVLSKAILPIIGVSLGTAGINQSNQSVLGIENFADQLGVSISKAWQVQLASAAVGGDSKLTTQLARLESQLQNVETTKPTLDVGTAESLGLGREAVEPASVQQALSAGGLKGAAEGLSLLFGSPTAAATAMQGMSAPTQLGLIETKLDDIKNANERVQITNDLFGARGGVNLLPLITQFEQEMGAAGEYEKTTGKGTLSGLLSESGTKGKATMESTAMGMSGMETSIEVALVKLDPALEKLTAATVKLLDWLEKELGHAGSVHKAVADTGKALTDVGDAFGGTGAGLKQTAAAQALGVGSFSSAETMKAIEDAANKYGINESAMLASSYAESGLIVNRQGGSTPSNPTKGTGAQSGLFQFEPATWTADYKSLYGKDPTKEAADYSASVQADVAAHAMAQGGVGKEKSASAATTDVITNFEDPGKPGSKGWNSDMTSATKFLEEFGVSVDKTSATVKSKAPEIPKDVADSLNKLIDEAKTSGAQFSSANEKYMEDTLKILEAKKPAMTTTAHDLMEGLLKGLQDEEPTLKGEAQKIADSIENTLNAALKIKSPSELTAEMGEQLIAGLGVGFQRGAPAAAALMGDTASRTVSSIHPALSGAGAGGGQVIELHVHSYLDGKEIAENTSSHMLNQLKILGGKTP